MGLSLLSCNFFPMKTQKEVALLFTRCNFSRVQVFRPMKGGIPPFNQLLGDLTLWVKEHCLTRSFLSSLCCSRTFSCTSQNPKGTTPDRLFYSSFFPQKLLHNNFRGTSSICPFVECKMKTLSALCLSTKKIFLVVGRLFF